MQTAYPFNTGYNYLLITGDITDDGDKFQFAKAFVGHLLLTPGNHDYGPLGTFYTEESAKAFDEYLLQKLAINHHYIDKQPMTDVLDDTQGTQVLAVGLNSVVNTEIPFDFARGEIGDDQLTSLQSILSDPKYANMHKLVYPHLRR